MHIAIRTASLSQDTPTALERAAALGFQHVEVNLLNHEFGYGYKRKANVRFYRELKRQLDNLGLAVWSFTSVPLTQEQMFFERARKDILMGAAGAGGILDAKVFTVKPADIFTSEINFESYLTDKNSPPMIEGYDEAWVQAVNRRITTAVLNYDHWIGIPLSNNAERMKKITLDLGIGWAMDVRRATHRGNLDEWLKQVGDRLAVAYAYDLAADGETPCAPAGPEWSAWAEVIKQTRLKCMVMYAHPSQSDEEIVQSREYLQSLLG
jgi:sugar phosphate isomerase/epimerase